MKLCDAQTRHGWKTADTWKVVIGNFIYMVPTVFGIISDSTLMTTMILKFSITNLMNMGDLAF
jgi:hypothetical protein